MSPCSTVTLQKKAQQEHVTEACFFTSEAKSCENNNILSKVSVIPERKHSVQAKRLASVQECVCHLPDQTVVKGNSHMNVICAQALIIWEKSVV